MKGLIVMEFHEALKRFRLSKGLSQAALANSLGIKAPLYQRYEWGETSPSVKFVIKLARAYDVSTDYLLGLSDDPQRFDAQEVKAAFALRDALKAVMSKQ